MCKFSYSNSLNVNLCNKAKPLLSQEANFNMSSLSQFPFKLTRSSLMCVVLFVINFLTISKAEQIMEAIELYKEESLKLLDYEEECKAAGKKVCSHTHTHCVRYCIILCCCLVTGSSEKPYTRCSRHVISK